MGSNQSKQHPSITFLFWNICVGANTIGKGEYDPNMRLPNVFEQIKRINATIISLAEFRSCDATRKLKNDLEEFGYTTMVFYNNSSNGSMGILVGWKRQCVHFLSSKVYYHSETPEIPSGPGWWTIFALCNFCLVIDGKPDLTTEFVICSTHLPLKYGDKKLAITAMVRVLSKLDKPLVLAGDFNTFGETDEELAESKELMSPLEKIMVLLSRWMGTWRGFLFDHPVPEEEEGSALDHVLTRGIEGNFKVSIFHPCKVESDHCGIEVVW